MKPTPSVTLDEAANGTWEAVVVGAGPAGALAARELGRRGVSVLLVDKAAFPRWKVCGSCLNGRALAALAGVGLGQLVKQLGAIPLTKLRLSTRQRESTVYLPEGMVVGREAFDAALVQCAIDAGAAFLPQTRAALADVRREARTVALHQAERERTVTARLVLAADGLGGHLADRAAHRTAQVQPGSRVGVGVIAETAPTFFQPGTIFMACGPGGYLGLARLEDGRLDIAAAFDAPLLRRTGGPGGAAVQLLETIGWPPVPHLAELAWRGTPGLTRRVPYLAAERLFVLGDAAGYIEPFTGEGIAWALEGAVALAPLAARAVQHWEPSLAERWRMQYRQVIGRHQIFCRVAAQVLRRPTLTGSIIALLGWAPWLAAPFVRFLNARRRL